MPGQASESRAGQAVTQLQHAQLEATQPTNQQTPPAPQRHRPVSDRGYKEYPLPDSWAPLLAGLQPARTSSSLPMAPELSATLDNLLELLTERERTVLHCRWVKGETLERTGERLGGITRERVRQIEARAILRFRENHGLLSKLLSWVDARALCVALLRDSRATVWPDLSAEELWCFMVRVLAAVTHMKYETRQIQDGTWVLRADSCCTARLRLLFETEPRFRTVSDVAGQLGVSARDLEMARGFEPELLHHQGGLLGWSRWSNADCLVALAWYLADASIRTWHFSQMAQALAIVWPERFEQVSGRDVLGILSRPAFDDCQNAGRNGVWQLTAQGDGHRNNRDAVIALLAEAGRPLATAEIMAGLKRVARPATIQALLLRDEAFDVTESGEYRLAG